MRTREKGFNIDVTRGQYMMLYNIMCEHNQMVNPESNPDFDLQTLIIYISSNHYGKGDLSIMTTKTKLAKL